MSVLYINPNLISFSVDVLVPNDAWPSANTVLISKSGFCQSFFSQYWLRICHIESYDIIKTAHEFFRDIAAFKEWTPWASYRWIPQYGRPPVKYMVLRVQVKFAHSLLRCGWPWVGHNLCLLWDYFCFIHSRLPFFGVEPQHRHQDFLSLSKVLFEGHIHNLRNISCWFKIRMGFVGPILINLGGIFHLRFSLVVFVMASWELRMQTCWWPLSDHCSSPHLTCLGLYDMAAWKLNGDICAI